VYRYDAIRADGTDPLLLNAYGGYETSLDPTFSEMRCVLVLVSIL
jgi:protease II